MVRYGNERQSFPSPVTRDLAHHSPGTATGWRPRWTALRPGLHAGNAEKRRAGHGGSPGPNVRTVTIARSGDKGRTDKKRLTAVQHFTKGYVLLYEACRMLKTLTKKHLHVC